MAPYDDCEHQPYRLHNQLANHLAHQPHRHTPPHRRTRRHGKPRRHAALAVPACAPENAWVNLRARVPGDVPGRRFRLRPRGRLPFTPKWCYVIASCIASVGGMVSPGTGLTAFWNQHARENRELEEIK